MASNPMTTVADMYRKAQRHLARRDQVLKRLIAGLGPCTLQQSRDRFGALVRSIIAQQISTKAAAAVLARLQAIVGEGRITAPGILGLKDAHLRAAGLSVNKARSLRDLAEKVASGSVALNQLHKLPDEEVISALVPVRGIGRWTAEMCLIFSLGRLDVLPVDDLGFRVGVKREYALPALPVKAQLMQLAEPWRPYRSVATWYFWRSLGNVRQSK
jgi:DNA-3-methyladenine glycosylase II